MMISMSDAAQQGAAAGSCGVVAPRRCHRIACVAATIPVDRPHSRIIQYANHGK